MDRSAAMWLERVIVARAAASVLEGSRGSSQALAGGELFHEMEPADVSLANRMLEPRSEMRVDDFGARARSRKWWC